MMSNTCAVMDGLSVSPGLSDNCSFICPQDENYDMYCGGPASFSLFSALEVTYMGIVNIPSENSNIDLLEKVPSGYPSLQQCYEKAFDFGYKYFLLTNGMNCSASSDPDAISSLQVYRNGSPIVKCGNGDPCGGPSTAALYAIDVSPLTPVSNGHPTSMSTMDCFTDNRCRAVLSTAFGIIGVVVLLCCAGVFIAGRDFWSLKYAIAEINEHGSDSSILQNHQRPLDDDSSSV